jgi:hypothetical protein
VRTRRLSAPFAGVGVEQVLGIVALVKRALLAELERGVALLDRGLAVVGVERRNLVPFPAPSFSDQRRKPMRKI